MLQQYNYQTDFLIVGAGIAGLALAIGFQQRGLNFLLVDKMSEITGIGAGIGITSNAIDALKQIGMAEKVKQIANPLKSLLLVEQNGKIILDGNPNRISGYNLTNYAIHRAALHNSLIEEIDENHILNNTEIKTIKYTNNDYVLITQTNKTISCKYLIGADGINSLVRSFMFPKSKIIYAGYTCWRSIIEWPGELPESSIETWGKQGRFGLTPLVNNQIYWYACINTTKSKDEKFKNFTANNLYENFKNYHELIPKALKYSEDKNLLHNDINYLQPLQQYHTKNSVLIGDAAHATTPNLGQGACMGLEDVAVLLQEIDSQQSFQAAINQFSNRRVSRCTKLVNSATLMGKIAQMDNPILCKIRNRLLPMLPESIQNKQLKYILTPNL